MKRKNTSISNADILYNYVHNNCPRRFFIDFYGVSSILSTLFMLCGQIVDKFIIFSIFNNSLFYKGLRGYLPQQFLYFLPLPHVVRTPIFIILIIFIILLIFQCFIVLGTYYIYNIYSIFTHSLYYKYLFLLMNLSNYLYLIISSIISDFVNLSKTSVANHLDFSVLEI